MILIVEDDYLIAALIERILLSAGFDVSGPIPRISEAQEVASYGAFDAAILDINLNGDRVYPVAEILSQRNVPYLFITGYSGHDLPAQFTAPPRINKPFKREELLDALSSLLRERVASTGLTSDGPYIRRQLVSEPWSSAVPGRESEVTPAGLDWLNGSPHPAGIIHRGSRRELSWHADAVACDAS